MHNIWALEPSLASFLSFYLIFLTCDGGLINNSNLEDITFYIIYDLFIQLSHLQEYGVYMKG